MVKRYDIPKDILSELYLKQKKSIKAIAKILNCSARTIHRRLKGFDIPRRAPWEHKEIKLNVEEIKRLYLEEKKSIDEIANKLGVSYSKIRTEMIKNNIPRRDSIELSLNRPDLKKTKNLCYILGVLNGDGYLYKNGSNYSIALESTDIEFIRSFKKSLEKLGLVINSVYSRKRSEKNHIIYKIECGSKLFFDWYKDLNLTKIRKTILKTNGEVDFIRGVYESEGSIFLTSDKRTTLTIASTNEELMLLIKELTNKLGFSPTFPKPQYLKSKKPYYKLYFNKQKEIRRFIDVICPCIKQKPMTMNQDSEMVINYVFQ